ncbi:hypothetical protein RBS60_11665 [Sinomonas sp. ASV486]|uniref:hypothetical protein n=1 Tax=Sinomonas sp. ASV486 TaxID=3051170 RepID=UPI0027DB6EE6|nr:hypothetical protein [Sinomonas sp. ASV486]MDQ4490851.1 hypothetical protein [Sinomonas sp. ASV486]
MSTAAVANPASSDVRTRPGAGHTERPRLSLLEEACSDCGRALALLEDAVCASCADLAAHSWCRDCGAVLADGDLEAGACADCTA